MIKTQLVLHEKILTRAIQIFLGVLTFFRVVMAWSDYYIDTRYFIETAKLILQGISPYHPETNPTRFPYPLQSPSMSLLSMPLCYTPELFQNLFFFVGNIVCFVALTVMVFNYYGFSPKKILEARWRNVPIWIMIVLIFVSSPFLALLRHGQNSCFAVFFLFLALLYPKRDKFFNIIYLGLAAAIKYSLLTMQVPVLIFQKRWRLCILSATLFFVMVLSVGLWLDGIIPAFVDYVKLVMSETQKGFNSHSGNSSYFLVDAGFFRYHFLNVIAKVSLLTLYFLTLRKIWLRGRKEAGGTDGIWGFPERLTALEWAAFTTLTMVISYHREYDCFLFLPFIGVVLAELLEKGYERGGLRGMELFCFIYLSLFLLYLAVPQSIVFRFESIMGKLFPQGEKLVYYSNYTPMQTGDTMFPFTKIIILLTAFFLFAVELFSFSAHRVNDGREDNTTA